MRAEQTLWLTSGWNPDFSTLDDAQLVLVFGGGTQMHHEQAMAALRDMYKDAVLVGCSTAGEIAGIDVHDDTLVATAIRFDEVKTQLATVSLDDVDNDSHAAGKSVAEKLAAEDLRHVLVFSDGLNVNGSELVRGLEDNLDPAVTTTGGLAADGDRFEKTWVLVNDEVKTRTVAAVGLYGAGLRVGHASLGGWDPFGPERVVTRVEGNVLYELDGKSALQLYKEYLGEHAEGLPATGLLYPLTVRVGEDSTPVVRTILSVDEEEQSMTFAGDIPPGSYARLMKANFDRLIDGASGAARNSLSETDSFHPELALLISCVGRKMVLQQRVEEEVEAVRDVVGDDTVMTGFYSYGEISPFQTNQRCELHNQTMTITVLAEGQDG